MSESSPKFRPVKQNSSKYTSIDDVPLLLYKRERKLKKITLKITKLKKK